MLTDSYMKLGRMLWAKQSCKFWREHDLNTDELRLNAIEYK
jgi:hypothetical protein